MDTKQVNVVSTSYIRGAESLTASGCAVGVRGWIGSMDAANHGTVIQTLRHSPALSGQESHLPNIQTWNFHAERLTGFQKKFVH